jgi:ribosomal protein S18 acetylase RimI-like enzyme
VSAVDFHAAAGRAAFARRVAAGEIDEATWTHRAHLAVALHFVETRGLSEALADMRAVLAVVLRTLGIPADRYHESITRAWMEVVERTFRSDPNHAFSPLETHADKTFLRRFYRVETLTSDVARARFVPPDLGPIEAAAVLPAVRLRWATETDLDDVRRLFRAYEAELGIDLCFQGFDRELAELPGAYAAPGGRLLVAEHHSDQTLVGCAALRPEPSSTDAGELKRMFVAPAFRGKARLGRRMAEALRTAARDEGYRVLRLDTLARLEAAVHLYESLGFERTAPYTGNPEPDVLYFEKPLDLIS